MYPPPPPLPTCTCEFSMAPCPVHPGRNCLTPVAPAPIPVQVIPVPTPAITTVKSRINVRAKGQRGEREVVDILQKLVSTIRSQYQLGDVLVQRNQNQSWQGGPDLHGLEGFAIEVKYQEQDWNNAWWKQTVEQGEKFKGVPILFYRRNGAKWKVMMRVFVNTPRDNDQIEMDVTVSLGDFTTWFVDAYSERCELEARSGA